MISIKKIATVMMLMVLAACANPMPGSTYGSKIDQATLNRFQKGKTTYAQVVQALGQPTSSMSSGDTRIVSYNYSEADSGTWIPGVMVTPAATRSATTTTMYFDANNILTNYTTTHYGG